MKEIIHIQAGELSNYVGTHYFNTLESYFSYGEDDGVYRDVAHDVSFREGQAPNGDLTYCPRLLIFDHQPNFGTLSKISNLYASGLDDQVYAGAGNIETTKQIPYEKSAYQQALDDGDVDYEPDHGITSTKERSVRFWSDYNRVYHLPRSLHPLPAPPNFYDETKPKTPMWEEGRDAFIRKDSDSELMEGDFRLFVEECDLLQGFHVTFDSGPFGSYTTTMMEAIRDELPKSSIMSFVNLENSRVQDLDIFNFNNCRKVINEALLLQRLNELSTMSIPLRSPDSWAPGEWSKSLEADFSYPYHTSALMAAHVETALLPLCLKSSHADMTQICRQLDKLGNNRFAHLSGSLPLPYPLNASSRELEIIFDYSQTANSSAFIKKAQVPGQYGVVRGLVSSERPSIADWLYKTYANQSPFMTTVWSDMPYPLPTSYPRFFKQFLLSSTGRLSAVPASTRIHSLPIHTAITSNPSITTLFSNHATFLHTFLTKGGNINALSSGGTIGKDELKELEEDMRQLADAFSGHSEEYDNSDNGEGDDFGDD